MSRLRVSSFGLSLDGFGAGPDQDLEHPLGVRGPELMEWFMETRFWRQMHGLEGGETGVDNRMAEQGFANLGAWILGRNMFGPVRGPWPDESWKGWWGEEPPYHVPVFVLTHHKRDPIAQARANWEVVMFKACSRIAPSGDRIMKSRTIVNCRNASSAMTKTWSRLNAWDFPLLG
jgi:dihydrofolate reductase